jgi:hypothetical protein
MGFGTIQYYRCSPAFWGEQGISIFRATGRWKHLFLRKPRQNPQQSKHEALHASQQHLAVKVPRHSLDRICQCPGHNIPKDFNTAATTSNRASLFCFWLTLIAGRRPNSFDKKIKFVCEIEGFCHSVFEVFALLGCYAAISKRRKTTTNLRCVTTQNSEELILLCWDKTMGA